MKENKGIIRKFGVLHYPDGKKISSRLPGAYQLSVGNQNCSNCTFYKNNKCEFWKAVVREEYWCKTWKNNISTVRGDYNELKRRIMTKVRKRIKPDSIHDMRLTKNIRTDRIKNKLIKNSFNKLQLNNELKNENVPKVNRDGTRKANSIGSLKRSRRRK